MARNKVRILCFPATSQLIGCRKQTFHKSTGGKCRPYPALVDIDSLSLTGKAPIVQLPCMTALPLPTQPKIASPVWLCAKFKYQKDTSLLIPKTSFQRPVKEIAEDYQVDIHACNSAPFRMPSAFSRMCDSSLQRLWRFKRPPKTCTFFFEPDNSTQITVL
ncbi:hypothetical protein B0H14DRAFT_800990 [Mycena olivaceomarginata]|nr:hypothetical protein B0H14DRAFT_800990 [Mycena olivaceomarginata]